MPFRNMPETPPPEDTVARKLINELIRKRKEEAAQRGGLDLGEFMSVADENVARNVQELQRQEAERERLRMLGMIRSNESNLPAQIYRGQD